MRTVLFEVQHLYYLPQFLPVIDELLYRKKFLIYASISTNESASALAEFKRTFESRAVQTIQAKTEEQRIAQCKILKPDVLFIGNIGQSNWLASNNTFKVMIYHGIGLKSSYYKDTDLEIDMYAIESQERIDNMVKQGIEKNKLSLCGFTKLDPMTKRKGLTNKKLLAEMGLNPDKKTIFYSPTFYPSSLEKTVYCLQSNELNFNLIIKLHQFSWQLEKYIHHIEAIAKLVNKENIFIVKQDDQKILDHYLVSDLLLTDISSTMFEYLILDRPIVQCLDLSFRKHHELMPWLVNKRFDHERMEKVDFTYQTKSADELIGILSSALDTPDELSNKRKKAMKLFHYKIDGKASSRLVDDIEAKLLGAFK